MAQVLYVNQDPNSQSRATQLGCGWVQFVPSGFASIATAPCVILNGAGQQTVLPDDGSLTAQQVATALAPILAAEQAAANAAATQVQNGQTLQQRAANALTANATFQAIGSPTNAQIANQVQSLTKQCNGIIRLLLNALDSTAGT